ncbi:MAG: bifunctional UDP-N-acetylglucosamine diphosphorylase/glucosamine-1-phosphate N-acetyltransferase GlmU [Actinobacteria bacterium]|nr:bifunctional UDP-N-acetylglucosamine diphosphorylase/glucosamine-1-phosphate N-acetyltransferase GlmU [Actinomycetota bacterium]
MSPGLSAVVMAGGLGTRMRSRTPKHLHELLGRRMIDWVIEAARPLGPTPLVVVASPATQDAFPGVEVALQERPLGTGDAVACARASLETRAEHVLILAGDTPLLTTELLEGLVEAHRSQGAAATVLSFRPEDSRSYGRVLRGEEGRLRGIVEAADATPEQLAIGEVNSSIYVFVAAKLWPALERLTPANAQGELYLTDAVRGLVEAGESVAVHEAPEPHEAEGVNTRVELAAAAAALRDRINERHMLAGVTIVDPATTWIGPEVELEPDSTVEPFTSLAGRSRVHSGAHIGPQAVVADAVVGPGALVGPFCYVRPGTVLEAGAKVGTFVEIKNSHIGAGAKVPHLSYIGDAEVGDRTNVGAGGITANYPHQPGRPKGRTTIGKDVRTGVHDVFMAPVTIADDSWIAASTVITDDVPPASLAGFPPRQVTKEGYLRERRDD